jgi:hypothetical protein
VHRYDDFVVNFGRPIRIGSARALFPCASLVHMSCTLYERHNGTERAPNGTALDNKGRCRLADYV